jgi:hypothetical protein
VRKLRACSGAEARLIGTGERSNGEPLRVTSILSLWASNSVPMPAVGERNVRAGTTDIASDATGTSSFRFSRAGAGAVHIEREYAGDITAASPKLQTFRRFQSFPQGNLSPFSALTTLGVNPVGLSITKEQLLMSPYT